MKGSSTFVCQEAHPLATIFDNAQLNAVALSLQRLARLRWRLLGAMYVNTLHPKL